MQYRQNKKKLSFTDGQSYKPNNEFHFNWPCIASQQCSRIAFCPLYFFSTNTITLDLKYDHYPHSTRRYPYSQIKVSAFKANISEIMFYTKTNKTGESISKVITLKLMFKY